MSALPPIPTPWALRWREFRIKAFPLLVFAALAGACVSIWLSYVTPGSAIGQVETLQANVISKSAGLLAQVEVIRFKIIRAGDPVAKVITTDPRVLAASLAVIKAEVELLQVGMLPLLQRERYELVFDRLRLDWLLHRGQLAGARIKLQYAESEFARVAQLFQGETNVVSRGQYEIGLRDRDGMRILVEQEESVVKELQTELDRLNAAAPVHSTNGPLATLRASIAVQEEKLKLTEAQLSPLTLTAPIDGMVTMVYRRSGENITAGEPLLTITATRPERIVAYLRHPLPFEPEVGMPVEVRARSLRRDWGMARIEAVNPHIEPLPRILSSTPLQNQVADLGLPIAITIPPGMKLHPGEPVDVRLVRRGK